MIYISLLFLVYQNPESHSLPLGGDNARVDYCQPPSNIMKKKKQEQAQERRLLVFTATYRNISIGTL